MPILWLSMQKSDEVSIFQTPPPIHFADVYASMSVYVRNVGHYAPVSV